MATLLSDTFNRANSTTAPGTPTTGGPYTAAAGTWGVLSNALYTSASLANAVLTFPAARDLDFTAKFITAADASGIVFRYIDLNNYWLLYQPTGTGAQWTLARRVAGTLITQWTGPVMAAGDTARVVAFGSGIYVFINNKFYGSLADMWASAPATNSPAGFYISSSTVAQIDDATAVDATAVPAGVGDGGGAKVPDTELRAATARQASAFIYKGRDSASLDTVGVA